MMKVKVMRISGKPTSGAFFGRMDGFAQHPDSNTCILSAIAE